MSRDDVNALILAEREHLTQAEGRVAGYKRVYRRFKDTRPELGVTAERVRLLFKTDRPGDPGQRRRGN